MLNRKRICLLAVLVLSLVLTGCFGGEDVADLIVQVEDQAGNPIEEAEVTILKNGYEGTEQGSNVQFGEIPEGEYDLEVRADGYETSEGEEVYREGFVLEEDLIIDVELEKIVEKEPTDETEKEEKEVVDEDEEEEEEKDEKEEVIEPVDLSLEFFDRNQNELEAEVSLKLDGELKDEASGVEVIFEDLEPGDYTIEVERDGYDKLNREITLAEEDKQLNLDIEGGAVQQHLFVEEGDEIVIEDLAADEEAIIGIFNLNLGDYEPTFDLDNELERLAKVEYDVRMRGVELAKEYGTDFAASSPDYSLGEAREFKISDDVKEGTITANLEAIGEHIYVFVDQNDDIDSKEVEQLVEEFDTNIYPALVREEGADEVVVVLSEFDSPYITSYFDAADLYAEQGNEEFMFYLNSAREENTILSSAVRQYQHLNFYLEKVAAGRDVNDVWIDEGLAHAAQILAGYIDNEQEGWSDEAGNGWLYDEDFGYLSNTEKVDLLIHDGSLHFSGAASLFIGYLYDQYGPTLIKSIVVAEEDPVTVIEEYTGHDFVRIYTNWITTNVADAIPEIDNRKYNYSAFDLQDIPGFSEEFSPLGVNYIEVEGTEETTSFEIPSGFGDDLGVVVIKRKK
ncbi:carboxypeptidase-like regulatory domain-containing protein [Natroniella sulfidigena]|uniref:carboxypeptidase-like regulatory domain-containing protein n=1 Tax=Natroniella sulfidigena TaxID=723921 RepID=UPI002009EB48|nr:carboxypeptidase-like regulatory domain-containing protein [Natroniella sulfidigena]MCK8816974.1 carboxypeptidase-like regulatory domain-containing protein [Natroniella sulfidigena]